MLSQSLPSLALVGHQALVITTMITSEDIRVDHLSCMSGVLIKKQQGRSTPNGLTFLIYYRYLYNLAAIWSAFEEDLSITSITEFTGETRFCAWGANYPSRVGPDNKMTNTIGMI